MACLTPHSFTLTISGVDPHGDDFENRLFEVGCDGATLILTGGETRVSFDREFATFAETVASATRDLLRAGATIGRIEGAELNALADAHAGVPFVSITLDDP